MGVVISYIEKDKKIQKDKETRKYFNPKAIKYTNDGEEKITGVPNPISIEMRDRMIEYAERQAKEARLRILNRIADVVIPFCQKMAEKLAVCPAALKKAGLVGGMAVMFATSALPAFAESDAQYARFYSNMDMSEKQTFDAAMKYRSELNARLGITDADEFRHTNKSGWSDAAERRMEFRKDAVIEKMKEAGVSAGSEMTRMSMSVLTESIQLEQILEEPKAKKMIKQQMKSTQVAQAGMS